MFKTTLSGSPSFALVVGAVENDLSELDLSTALTYALSDSSEIGVSYTNRTQKYAEEPVLELNDSFAKVYFKTSF
jgi:hypothetical protein